MVVKSRRFGSAGVFFFARRELASPVARGRLPSAERSERVAQRSSCRLSMKTFITAFLVALVVAALLTPAVRALALRIGAVSAPGGRHKNAATIPRLGGVAIFVAVTLPVLGLFLVESSVANAFRAESRRVAGLLTGGFLMCALGFLDDTRRVRALYKLYAQLGIAALAWVAGFRIGAIDLPLIGMLDLGASAFPVTVLWIVGITNAINLIDGLDGLAAGVVFFAALTNLVVAHVAGASFVAVLMASVLGAVLGFLFHNFNPARIYMGDSGSYFLGYVLATTSLAGCQKASTAVSLLVPVLALGLPIFDTLFALVRRFIERRPIFSPDRGHVHHRLIDMGLTQRRAVLLLYAVCLACTAIAILTSLGRSWAVGGLLVFLSVTVTCLIRFMGAFHRSFAMRRQKARLRTRHAELLRRIVPQLAGLFERTRVEADVFTTLDEIARRAGLCAIEIVDSPHHHSGNVIRAWNVLAHGDPKSADALRARYPLGPENRAVASIRFVWHGDDAAVAPQEEVLLQIIADVCADRLAVLGSELVGSAPDRSPLKTPAPMSRPTAAH